MGTFKITATNLKWIGGVIITLADGTSETVDIEEYTAKVFQFADMIKDFYKFCTPKILPEDDELKRDGYIAFWNEWHRGSRTNYPEIALGYDGSQA